ncbi:MAG: methylmalonyl Co-A mutase-associated GTPase MeaB [Deltaproteobacteria bacterium]|nr:methylmalonyl Co-A mutase-associated GTPase MeaB [Deltaproteobacteria bacterium]
MKIDAQTIIRGNQLAGARLIRQLEEGDPAGIELLKRLYTHTGNAFVIGITGPPGSGKSTLANCIITDFRQRKKKVAVVAIDPSSSISGGALLGDRIRMRRHTEDDGVFIRSMATRGHLGGLSKTTRETVLVFDAMGYDIVIIETVGVGQDEVEIAQFAHTTAVVSLPGMGDDIQAMKAGLLEIGDIFIVNKADSPGADDVVLQLRNMLEMSSTLANDWHPPILKTVAVESDGTTELVDAFLDHHQYLIASGKFGEHNFKWEFEFFRQLVMQMAAERLLDSQKDSPAFLNLLQNLKQRKIDPFSAAEGLLKGMGSQRING